MKKVKCYRIKHRDTSGLRSFDYEILGENALEMQLHYIEHVYGIQARKNTIIEERIVTIYEG